MDGGDVAAYRVQRRQRDSGEWWDVGMAIETDVTLGGQDAAVEYEYRVPGSKRSASRSKISSASRRLV